jgi:polyketide biosynthesis enoyl-CoA hydratase PksH
MGLTMYETLRVRRQDATCFIQLHRPEANNAINTRCLLELTGVLSDCEAQTAIVVLEGLPEVFCLGADFQEKAARGAAAHDSDPQLLYDLWLKLATAPCISIAHVRGKANAGGIGFVAACDVVLADESAQFSLSELLFGLYPACVFPFLARRIGFQRAHFMTLTTQPVGVQQAHAWGLVDAYEAQSELLLRRLLARVRRISKTAIGRYKQYVAPLATPSLADSRSSAIAANREVFSDPHNLRGIIRYVERGLFPWES